MKEMGASMPFDGQRMIFGGFAPIVDETSSGSMGYADGYLLAVPDDNKQAYLDMAERHHAALQIIECHGQFRNVHGVPDDKIDAMRKRWQQLPERYR